MRRLLIFLALGVLLYLGYQWWGARQPDTAANPAPAPPASARSAPAIQPQPMQSPQRPTIEPPPRIQAHVQMVNPGMLMEGTPQAALLNGVRQTLEQGNATEAEARLVTLPQSTRDDPAARKFIADLWNNVGVAHAATRGIAAGLKAFQTAVSLDPSGARAHVNLTHALWELKEPGLSRDLLETTVALAPEEPLPHLLLADILQAKNDLKGAVAQLDLAAQHLGHNPKLQSFVRAISAKIKREAEPNQEKKEGIAGKEPAR
jgi:predicted Zn-dependent protease